MKTWRDSQRLGQMCTHDLVKLFIGVISELCDSLHARRTFQYVSHDVYSLIKQRGRSKPLIFVLLSLSRLTSNENWATTTNLHGTTDWDHLNPAQLQPTAPVIISKKLYRSRLTYHRSFIGMWVSRDRQVRSIWFRAVVFYTFIRVYRGRGCFVMVSVRGLI